MACGVDDRHKEELFFWWILKEDNTQKSSSGGHECWIGPDFSTHLTP